jgi:hypothetical protein
LFWFPLFSHPDHFWVWVYLHCINPKQVSILGYRTSQRVTYISLLVQIIVA